MVDLLINVWVLSGNVMFGRLRFKLLSIYITVTLEK